MCHVSGDSLMGLDENGVEVVLADSRNARLVLQTFRLEDSSWKLFERVQLTVIPEGTSCEAAAASVVVLVTGILGAVGAARRVERCCGGDLAASADDCCLRCRPRGRVGSGGDGESSGEGGSPTTTANCTAWSPMGGAFTAETNPWQYGGGPGADAAAAALEASADGRA